MSGSIRLMIFGSCVSRDMLNFDRDERFQLVRYLARSSLASAFAEPFDARDSEASIASAFQRRMVEADGCKQLRGELLPADYDVLLLDLIDERFALLFDGPRVATDGRRDIHRRRLRDASAPDQQRGGPMRQHPR